MLRLSAPSVRTISRTSCLPVAHRALGPAAQVARGAAEVLAGVRQQRARRRPSTATTRRPARRPPRRARGSGSRGPDSTATVTRSACWGLPLTALTTRSRSQPTRFSSDLSSSPVPTNSCQRASTSPRSRVPSAEAVEIAAIASSYALSASSRSRPAAATCSATASATPWVRRVRVRMAPSRVCLTTAPRALGVLGERLEPAADVGDGRRRQQPVVGDRGLVDGEQRGVLEPAAGEHPGQVGGHGLHGVGGGAVEHDRDRGRALGGLAQVVPRHLVGVPGGRGDEQPQVGGGEQLGGQRAVALLDRVDVGGVEDGQPGGHGVGGDQLEGLGVGRSRA